MSLPRFDDPHPLLNEPQIDAAQLKYFADEVTLRRVISCNRFPEIDLNDFAALVGAALREARR